MVALREVGPQDGAADDVLTEAIEEEALDAYSSSVSGAAARLIPSVASLRVAPGGSFAKIFGGGFVLGCLGRSGREYVLEQSDVRSDRPASRFTLRGAFNRSAIQRI